MLLHPTDRFVPEPPYKLTTNFVPPLYVPLSEPGEPTDIGSSEFGPTPVQTSDTPSTPTSIPRKRNREQAYFDSPSGFLVFSGFDKDGMPRRPRKLRKLRFDPSFSPEGGRPGREAVRAGGSDWPRDHDDASKDEFSEESSQDKEVDALRGSSHTTTVRSFDTPEKPFAYEGPSASYCLLSVDERLSKSTRVSSPAISTDKQGELPPVRTIDFTNLSPPARRWRFPRADNTKSGGKCTILSVVKSTEHKVKTPKKISFADHARVCVYMVSPQREDIKEVATTRPARQYQSEEFEDEPELEGKTRLSDKVVDSDDSTAEAIKDLASQTDSTKTSDGPTRVLDRKHFEDDTLTLTMEEVRAMRHRLESAAKNGVATGQLANLFELGKTFQGMSFRHVW